MLRPIIRGCAASGVRATWNFGPRAVVEVRALPAPRRVVLPVLRAQRFDLVIHQRPPPRAVIDGLRIQLHKAPPNRAVLFCFHKKIAVRLPQGLIPGMSFRWAVAPWHSYCQPSGKLSRLLNQCLVNRGVQEPAAIEAFLQPKLKNLSDPALIPNLSQAVDRLIQARDKGEAVVLFGDYDVDGVTSAALLIEVLRELGWKLECYLPKRFDEGYGLTPSGVERCLALFPATLMLAVDCGSTAFQTVEALRNRGVETIILDHHRISDPAPVACALVNPRLDDGGRFHELCSAGLAFKLAHEIVKRERKRGSDAAEKLDLKRLLDLVALGTIADLVPLCGENRILVSAGLQQFNPAQRPGLMALVEVAQVSGPIGTYEISFQLAPRLNAAGRLEDAASALALLLTRSHTEALTLAQQLDRQNRERQRIEKGILDEVRAKLLGKFNAATDFVIVEGGGAWHAGVVGIVAARVAREFGRPTVIVGGEAAEWRGSGRSIEGFDLAVALAACADLLLRHGGHSAAAGLSIVPDRLDEFRSRLNALARETLTPERLQPELKLDAEVPLAELSLESIDEIERLAPFGQGNPNVRLLSRGVGHRRPPQLIGKEKRHLKMWVTDGQAEQEAIWWNCESKRMPTGSFDLAYSPERNEFRGKITPLLKVLDWRPS